MTTISTLLERWRQEPYLVFFFHGAFLAWLGILPWLLLATGLSSDYPATYHAYTQIQGFLTTFAIGFLFTALPRRTGTARPSKAQVVAGLALPFLLTLAAWRGAWVTAQLIWVVLALLLLEFALRRFFSPRADRRPPIAFIWVPISLLMSLAGALFILSANLQDSAPAWLEAYGRLLLLQGYFLGLIVGVGALVFPLLTRSGGTRDATRADLGRGLLHLVAALLLLLSFALEVQARYSAGYALRGAVVLIVLLFSAEIWRPPSVPGWHRRAIWLTPWLTVLGYAIAAIAPEIRQGALHVTLIGGFALLAFTVGMHVALAHSGFKALVNGRSPLSLVLAAAFLAAGGARLLAETDPPHRLIWLGTAALLFLAGTLAWGGLMVPRIRPFAAAPETESTAAGEPAR